MWWAHILVGLHVIGGLSTQRCSSAKFVVLSEGETSLVNLSFSGPGPFRKQEFHEKRGEIKHSGFWEKGDAAYFHGPSRVPDAYANTVRGIDLNTAAGKNW